MLVIIDSFNDMLYLAGRDSVVIYEEVHYHYSLGDTYISYVSDSNLYAIKDGIVYAHKLQRDLIEFRGDTSKMSDAEISNSMDSVSEKIKRVKSDVLSKLNQVPHIKGVVNIPGVKDKKTLVME